MTKNTVAVKKGDRLAFKGYTDLEEGMEPLFEEGDILIAASVTKEKNGDIKVKAYKEGGDKDDMDTLFFPDEVELASDEEEEVEEEEVEEEAKPAKSKAKAKEAAPAKSKAVAAPARTEEEAEQAPIHHVKSVAKIIKKAEASDGILEAAKSLVVQGEQTDFNLGGVLAEIQSHKTYVTAGYKGDNGWEEYLEAELGLKYRKAMYLIENYKTCVALGIDEERIAHIGWTKLRSIVRVASKLTEKQLEQLLEKANKSTRGELDAFIDKKYVGAAGASERISKVVYKFTAMGDEAEYINAAIARAQELVEGGDVNAALKHIVREWSMMADGVDLKLEDAMKAVETRFGVKLAVNTGEAEEVAEEEAAPAKKAKAVSTKSAAKKVTSTARPAKKATAKRK